MAGRDEIVAFLNGFLECEGQRDYCPQGLQIEGSEEVQTIALGVTAEPAFFDRARDLGAQLLVVHHGFFWDGEPRTLIGNRRRRVQFLLENDMSLVAYHLPLDRHLEVGNNAQIAKRLGCIELEPFAESKGLPIGVRARFDAPVSLETVEQRLGQELVAPKAVLPHGPDTIETVGIISGGGSRMVSEAVDAGLDLYITGEMDFTAPSFCQETGIHYVALGHHDSERWGVMALGPVLEEKFGVKTEFLNVENPY